MKFAKTVKKIIISDMTTTLFHLKSVFPTSNVTVIYLLKEDGKVMKKFGLAQNALVIGTMKTLIMDTQHVKIVQMNLVTALGVHGILTGEAINVLNAKTEQSTILFQETV